MINKILYYTLIISLCISCSKNSDIADNFFLNSVTIAGISLNSSTIVQDIPLGATLKLNFSTPIDKSTVAQGIVVAAMNQNIPFDPMYSNGDKSISIVTQLDYATTYRLTISPSLKDINGQTTNQVSYEFRTEGGSVTLDQIFIDGIQPAPFEIPKNVSLTPEISLYFSSPIDLNILTQNLKIAGISTSSLIVSHGIDDKEAIISIANQLEDWEGYQLEIKESRLGENGELFAMIKQPFFTTIDSTYDFPLISDEALMDKVQAQTFKYFWDFAESNSGMAKERNTSNTTVTSGGSGFGLMAMIVGVERGMISRGQAIERWEQIVTFLESADRFHGAWSHWINGSTGKVVPFSQNDDGGDLVETAFLVQGLLTVRQYLDSLDSNEKDLIDRINVLWEEVEWDWYRQGGQDVLYWHWSPQFGFQKNLKITGHNETQIVYVLAASSSTHPIPKKVYTEGYARSGRMVNGQSYYGIQLPLGPDIGGPLFFSHYSYLGLDPRKLKDEYADYWKQNVAHSQINFSHATRNPNQYLGYSSDCWGITASDGNNGYSAHSPRNDKGVITPTAALSSIPYTPEASMDAMRFFYYILGDKIWGEYGFFDAFNPGEGWYASSYLAIDQGPIICMIENHRSGILWDLFMSAPEIQKGLDKLGFTY